ncbi:lytic polysaccharide monooxygenase auxiliary activity family 9 protein [Streptomyces sp. NPDC002004]
MPARRKARAIAVVGAVPLALTALSAAPAAAHGSMTDPVSRVAGCYAEGPESPRSAACKAAVAASGPQAFYDWNAVNIADAAGKSKQIIPDGKLCSAGNAKYRGLDLPRADWPATRLSAGRHTFHYKGTAPHKGSFALYITRPGYDPTKPLKWSDLESKPFLTVTDPRMVNGDYVFDGNVPARSGRQLIYSVWQRSDSPEAFYTCSDVVFGKDSGGSGATAAPAPTASAPTDREIEDGADKSTVEHHHGDGGAHPQASASTTPLTDAGDSSAGNTPEADGSAEQPAGSERLAETGGDASTAYLAVGGAAVLALGAGALFASVRRRAAGAAVGGGRHSR